MGLESTTWQMGRLPNGPKQQVSHGAKRQPQHQMAQIASRQIARSPIPPLYGDHRLLMDHEPYSAHVADVQVADCPSSSCQPRTLQGCQLNCDFTGRWCMVFTLWGFDRIKSDSGTLGAPELRYLLASASITNLRLAGSISPQERWRCWPVIHRDGHLF